MKILVTGGSGLVGSRIVELLKDNYEFDSSTEDITQKDSIQNRIENSNAQIVLHLAAKAHVDGCEEDKNLGEQGEAWKINVEGTKNVSEACLKLKKKLIYVSTDFVFDGEKESYVEDDTPNPINWYGKTKYEGELAVQNSGAEYIIARIAYPYRTKFVRTDFIRALIEKFKKGENLTMVTDHIMVPTFIDDIAFALDSLVQKEQTGVFHVTGSQPISPFDTAVLIADTFGFSKSKIAKTTRADYFKGRAERGFHLNLKNDKISRLGIKMKTLQEGLLDFKSP
ncbi:MAG TPA: NAD(P)-dependent oxidoreductase [Patescibacteria group bacterium]|nr:NAD(P)-dependent oxidoreductase [Patescibacteria group bacterium]